MLINVFSLWRPGVSSLDFCLSSCITDIVFILCSGNRKPQTRIIQIILEAVGLRAGTDITESHLSLHTLSFYRTSLYISDFFTICSCKHATLPSGPLHFFIRSLLFISEPNMKCGRNLIEISTSSTNGTEL